MTPPVGVILKTGATSDVKLKLSLQPGYHVNSNTPSDKFLIPLKLTWNPGPAQVEEIIFPKPQMQKVDFPPNQISVFTGQFELTTRFKVAPGTSPGPTALVGKLRYQACNDRMCLTPKTIDVAMQADVVK